MGANEKHDATYHGGEYTPSTEEVRKHWENVGFAGTGTEFDRWLETVRAEAKAEALIEYADAIQHVDDVIQRQADSDDRWTDFQDAEREFTRNDVDVARDYYTAATHYARYRANQYKEQ